VQKRNQKEITPIKSVRQGGSEKPCLARSFREDSRVRNQVKAVRCKRKPLLAGKTHPTVAGDGKTGIRVRYAAWVPLQRHGRVHRDCRRAGAPFGINDHEHSCLTCANVLLCARRREAFESIEPILIAVPDDPHIRG
jgi:hypothetical protein